MKYINKNSIALKERFPQVGEVSIEPNEIKELPDDVAQAWMNPRRQSITIEPVVEEEPSPIPEGLPTDYQELIKLAKSLNIDLPKSPKKAEVIELINSLRKEE